MAQIEDIDMQIEIENFWFTLKSGRGWGGLLGIVFSDPISKCPHKADYV